MKNKARHIEQELKNIFKNGDAIEVLRKTGTILEQIINRKDRKYLEYMKKYSIALTNSFFQIASFTKMEQFLITVKDHFAQQLGLEEHLISNEEKTELLPEECWSIILKIIKRHKDNFLKLERRKYRVI